MKNIDLCSVKMNCLKCNDINIRDPFVVFEDGRYYMYGTRARNFGTNTAGFDVYISTDLENWSEPIECFNSELHNMNAGVNWAPEVHRYHDSYYMFATFTMPNGRRGTYILQSLSLLGPFTPHSKGAVTPNDWECLDGTLYISREGKPYLVFCHEHRQIIDGTMCYSLLKDDLTGTIGEPVTMFSASSPYWADPFEEEKHYITDCPFLYRTKTDRLLMIWSTFINGNYAECLLSFDDGELGRNFTHLPPIITDDGGHGMLFNAGDKLYLPVHFPNVKGSEHPLFIEMEDMGDTIRVK